LDGGHLQDGLVHGTTIEHDSAVPEMAGKRMRVIEAFPDARWNEVEAALRDVLGSAPHNG
jgi:hypothetical protein